MTSFHTLLWKINVFLKIHRIFLKVFLGVFPQAKSEVYEIFKDFKVCVDNFSGKNISALSTNNGKEYVNNNLQELCEENGIQMQHIVPYAPQQNGVVECKNRALKEVTT